MIPRLVPSPNGKKTAAPLAKPATGAAGAPPSDTSLPLARDHASPEPSLALAKAPGLDRERVVSPARGSRSRRGGISLEGALAASFRRFPAANLHQRLASAAKR